MRTTTHRRLLCWTVTGATAKRTLWVRVAHGDVACEPAAPPAFHLKCCPDCTGSRRVRAAVLERWTCFVTDFDMKRILTD